MNAPPRGASVAAALTVAALVAAAASAAVGAMPSTVAITLALAFLPYGGLLVVERPLSLRAVLSFAAVAGLALALAPTILSDDLYRYLWDGRVLRAGLDPYRFAPSDPALATLRDEHWAQVNHPRIPTIYPPIAQGIFATVGAIVHHPIALKVAALLAHLATVPVVARIAREVGVDPGRAAALHGLNPLALSESALGGHVDAFAALFVGLFALALITGRPFRSAAAAVAAAGVKLVGLLVAPLLWRRSRLAALLAIALGLLWLVPLLTAGDERAVGGFGQYARRWGGNAGAFALAESAVAGAAEHAYGIGPGRVRFEVLREPLTRWQGTALDPMASFQREKKERGDPAELEASVVGSLGARLLVALALGLAALWLARLEGPADAAFACRSLLLLALLLLPQLHPWYLLWLLPLEAAIGGGAGLAFAAVVLVAYAPLDGWIAGREWEERTGAVAFEHGLIWALWLAESLLRRVSRRRGEGADRGRAGAPKPKIRVSPRVSGAV